MDASFQQVSRRYGFPYDRSNKTSIVDWLLGAAVRLEYADNAEQLTKASETMASAKAVDSSQEPCSARDVDEASDDFKAGVALLAKIFQLPSHADHLRVLDAVAVLVEQRLSSEARVRAKEAKERRKEGDKLEFVPLSKADLGFDLSGRYPTRNPTPHFTQGTAMQSVRTTSCIQLIVIRDFSSNF
eukprot:m.253906 g.253906  ORF g.253906 m.253906 type:complete len:186 (+) comp40376_c1_seq1:212-769(+)